MGLVFQRYLTYSLDLALRTKKKTTKQTNKQQAKRTKTKTNRKKHISIKEATTLKGDF